MKRILVPCLLALAAIMVGCDDGTSSDKPQRHPLDATANEISSEEASEDFPELLLPRKAVHISSSRKEEPNATVVTSYYKLPGSLSASKKHFQNQDIELRSSSERGALFSTRKRTSNGGMKQIQAKLEVFDPEREMHFEKNQFQEQFGLDLKPGTVLVKLFRREPSS